MRSIDIQADTNNEHVSCRPRRNHVDKKREGKRRNTLRRNIIHVMINQRPEKNITDNSIDQWDDWIDDKNANNIKRHTHFDESAIKQQQPFAHQEAGLNDDTCPSCWHLERKQNSLLFCCGADRSTGYKMKEADDTYTNKFPFSRFVDFFICTDVKMKFQKKEKKATTFFSFRGVGANNWTGWHIVGRSRACKRLRCCRTTFRPPWIRDWSLPRMRDRNKNYLFHFYTHS